MIRPVSSSTEPFAFGILAGCAVLWVALYAMVFG